MQVPEQQASFWFKSHVDRLAVFTKQQAQVNGLRGETDTLEKMEKRVEHDLDYIRRWGLWLDVKIIMLTVFSPKVHRNAY